MRIILILIFNRNFPTTRFPFNQIPQFFSLIATKIIVFSLILSGLGFAKTPSEINRNSCSDIPVFKDDPPEWVKKMKSPKHPDNLYIAGIGIIKSSGNEVVDMKNADNDAFAQIIKQITANIKSEEEFKSYEEIKNQESSYSEKTDYSVKVSSSLELQGLIIAERYYDKSKEIYYSLGVLDRKKISSLLKLTIENSESIYNQNIKLASENYSSGSVNDALFNIKECIRQSKLFNSSVPIHNIISGDANLKYQLISDNDINKILSSIVSTLKISFISGDKQEILPDKALSEPLIFRVTVNETGIPASGVTVRFNFVEGNGDLLSVVKTDKTGLAPANVVKLYPDSKIYIIVASVDLSEFTETEKLFSDFNKSVSNANFKSTVTLKQTILYSGVKVLINIDELVNNQNGSNKIIVSVLEKKLLENGMTAVYNAGDKNYSIIITGEFQASPFNDLNGIKVSTAAGFIKAEKTEGGKLLAQENISDVRGMGNDDIQAGLNALKKLSEKILDSFLKQLISGEYK